MTDDPRDILRLKCCPECDYDLRGLPHAHSCPECGFAYSDDFFDLFGTSRGLRRPLSLSRVLFILGLFTLVVIDIAWAGGFRFWQLLVVFAVFVLIGVLALPMRRRRHDTPCLRRIFTDSGILLTVDNEKVMVQPWSAIKSVSVVRLSNNKWRLRIRAPIYSRLSIRYGIKAADLNMILDCTDDEAALVCRELQQRLQRAHSASAAS